MNIHISTYFQSNHSWRNVMETLIYDWATRPRYKVWLCASILGNNITTLMKYGEMHNINSTI